MHSKSYYRAVTLALVTVGITVGIYCSYDRNNPLDPGAPNYVGEGSAGDNIPPTLVVTSPSTDSSTTDFDSVVVRGTAFDQQNGIKSITVNGTSVLIDDTLMQGGALILSWHITVYLTGTSTITVVATDNSQRLNTSTRVKVVTRITTPSAPTDLVAALQGARIALSWTDASRNETGFVIEQRFASGGYVALDTVGPDQEAYVDSLTAFQPSTAYYYRVVAVNASGRSAPSGEGALLYPSVSVSDTTNPVIAFVSPANGDTINQVLVDVILTVNDASGIKDGTVKVNGTVATLLSGQWHAQVTLTPGVATTLSAAASDNSANANVGSASVIVFCDTAAVDTRGPTIVFVSPTNGATIPSSRTDVTVSIIDNSGVAWARLNGADMVASGSDFVLTSVSLSPGLNTLQVQAEDILGNPSTLSVTVTYDTAAVDTTPPTVKINYPQNNSRFSAPVVTIGGTATDASGIASVQVNGLPATLTGTTWTLSYTLVHGTSTLRVSATDGSAGANAAQDSVTVLQNTPPTASGKGDTTFTLGAAQYATSVVALDSDGDSLIYQLIRPDIGGAALSMNTDGTARVTFTPSTAGAVTFIVKAQDSWGDSAIISWTLNVVQPGNAPPVFTVKPNDTTIYPNTGYVGPIAATDPEMQTVTMSIESGLPGMTLLDGVAATNRVRYTASKSDTGYKTVTIRATDGANNAFYTYHITVARGNAAPVATPAVTAITKNQNDSVIFDVNVADADSDGIVFMQPLSGTSPVYTGWTMAQISGTNQWRFRWKVPGNASGSVAISLVFRDSWTPSKYDTATVTVTVNSANQPPVFASTPLPLAAATIGQVYRDTLAVSDPNGDSLTITVLQGPGAFTPTLPTPLATSVYLSWVPAAAVPTSISIRLADKAGGSDTLTWTIQVADTGLGHWSNSGLKDFGGSSNITAAHIDRASNFWVGFKADGVHYSTNGAVGFTKVTASMPSEVKCFGSAREYGSGLIVFAGLASGVNGYLYSATGANLNTWTQRPWPVDSPMTDIVSDDLRILACSPSSNPNVRTWLATADPAALVSGLPTTLCNARRLAMDTVTNMGWVALSNKTVYRHDFDSSSQPWSNVGTVPYLVTDLVFSVADRRLIAGTLRGTYGTAGGATWTLMPGAPSDTVLNVLCVPATGDLFIMYDGAPYSTGTYVLKNSTGEMRYVAGSKSLPPGYLAASPAGVVYMACRNGKIYKYTP